SCSLLWSEPTRLSKRSVTLDILTHYTDIELDERNEAAEAKSPRSRFRLRLARAAFDSSTTAIRRKRSAPALPRKQQTVVAFRVFAPVIRSAAARVPARSRSST